MTEPIIHVEGLIKNFDQIPVLNGVDIRISSGESLVLIGRSGSGKTVLLKTLMGLLRPDSGRLQIVGQNIAHLNSTNLRMLHQQMGMVFQKAALFDSLPVWENVAFRLMQQKGIRRTYARSIAIEKLRIVGLSEHDADVYPAALSGGMKKRVGFARAIVDQPRILLLDEPTAGLDPIMTRIVNDLIIRIVREIGATVLSITSDMDGARQIADRVAMLDEGRIIWCGSIAAAAQSGNPTFDTFFHLDRKTA